MKVSGVLFKRVRGFRVVDLGAMVVFLALALTVYAFKTSAGSERSDIADVEDKIHDEQREVALLRAEVAHLESPDRLEQRARAYAGQAPVSARQELSPEGLAQVAAPIAPAPPAAAPTNATPANATADGGAR
ncbi:MAG TPA: cell division protein [Caulobacteraceae bacterium]|nr:cell division protein [Caulobacteraceae bacterium]